MMGLSASLRFRSLRVGAQKFAESLLVHRAGSEIEDGVRRRFLARREAIAVEFEKEYADNKTRTLVTIDEKVILHNTGCVLCRKLDNIGALVGAMVLRPAERGVE